MRGRLIEYPPSIPKPNGKVHQEQEDQQRSETEEQQKQRVSHNGSMIHHDFPFPKL